MLSQAVQSEGNNSASSGKRRKQSKNKNKKDASPDSLENKFNILNLKLNHHSSNAKSQSSCSPNRGRDGSSNSRGAAGPKSKSKTVKAKYPSFNLPPQLKNQTNMNYSQTQKFDLRDINEQLLAMQYSTKQGGST
jgi:hypothetical protein